MPIDGDILEGLREQTKWLRLLGLQALRPVLEQTLRTDKHRLVYEYSNGLRSVRDIAALTGTSTKSVTTWWSEWLSLGICTESRSQAGRAVHLAPLSRLGIDVPLVAAKVDANGVSTTQDSVEAQA